MTESLSTQIEQAIAYGRTKEWIIANLNVTQQDIYRALRLQREALEDDRWYQANRVMGGSK